MKFGMATAGGAESGETEIELVDALLAAPIEGVLAEPDFSVRIDGERTDPVRVRAEEAESPGVALPRSRTLARPPKPPAPESVEQSVPHEDVGSVALTCASAADTP